MSLPRLVFLAVGILVSSLVVAVFLMFTGSPTACVDR